jgi:hypothetical protein
MAPPKNKRPPAAHAQETLSACAAVLNASIHKASDRRGGRFDKGDPLFDDAPSRERSIPAVYESCDSPL